MHGFERGFMNNVIATARKRKTTLALQLNRDGVGIIKRMLGGNFLKKKTWGDRG